MLDVTKHNIITLQLLHTYQKLTKQIYRNNILPLYYNSIVLCKLLHYLKFLFHKSNPTLAFTFTKKTWDNVEDNI